MKKTHFFLDIYTKIKNINIILVRGIGCGKDEGATTTGDSVTCGVYIFKNIQNKNTYTHHHYYKNIIIQITWLQKLIYIFNF